VLFPHLNNFVLTKKILAYPIFKMLAPKGMLSRLDALTYWANNGVTPTANAHLSIKIGATSGNGTKFLRAYCRAFLPANQ
jgi:hypothetical protein